MIMTAATPSRISGGCEAILSTMSPDGGHDLAGQVARAAAATAHPGPLADDAPVLSHAAIFSPYVADGQSQSARGRLPLMRGSGQWLGAVPAARVWAACQSLPLCCV